MKKILSVLLLLIMLFTAVMPVALADEPVDNEKVTENTMEDAVAGETMDDNASEPETMDEPEPVEETEKTEESGECIIFTVSAEKAVGETDEQVLVKITVKNQMKETVEGLAVTNSVNDGIWEIAELKTGAEETFELSCQRSADDQKEKSVTFKAVIGNETFSICYFIPEDLSEGNELVLKASVKAVEKKTEEVTEEKPLTIGESALFMLKGMVGIFLVTGLIILVLVIMDKAGNRKKETEE